MPKNNIINLFEEILDTSYILSGDELKSRFYHIWKTDIPTNAFVDKNGNYAYK